MCSLTLQIFNSHFDGKCTKVSCRLWNVLLLDEKDRTYNYAWRSWSAKRCSYMVYISFHSVTWFARTALSPVFFSMHLLCIYVQMYRAYGKLYDYINDWLNKIFLSTILTWGISPSGRRCHCHWLSSGVELWW